VNDIGGSNDSAATLNAMKTTYAKLIKSGRDKGLLVYGGTIMPFTGYTGSAGYDTPAHEALRQEVNAYIKSGVFDGVIDFDAALSDGATPPSLVAAANSADKLHPGPAGYQMMADKVDLTLFTK